MSDSVTLAIDRTWDGRTLPARETATVTLTPGESTWHIAIDAPLAGDPPPPSEPGSTPGLWEFEVVEVMLLGLDDRYLEVEFSPHGHYLVLELHGRRNPVKQGHLMHYAARRGPVRWRGEASIPTDWLPPECSRVNAYAIRGQGQARIYMAHSPPGGDAPDFHRLSSFVPLAVN